jgi:hypothetical protein
MGILEVERERKRERKAFSGQAEQLLLCSSFSLVIIFLPLSMELSLFY